MLIVRQAQLESLVEGRWRAFEREACELWRTNHPETCAQLDDERLKMHVESAIRNARTFGFYLAEDLHRYLGFTMTEGLEFDREDWAAAILSASNYYPSTRLDLLAWTADDRRHKSEDAGVDDTQDAITDATWPIPAPALPPPPYALQPPDPSCYPPPPDADPGRDY